MLPTDVLKSEHRVIEQVLNCLEKIADRAAAGEFDRDSAQEAIDFLKNFADRCHHGKEEMQLFPLLEERGFDREHGPTGVMCDEHVEGRALISGMVDGVTSAAPHAAKLFADHARRYIELLRVHINKEDHCLFAMADRVLSPADQEVLMARFDKVEEEDMGQGTHEHYLRIADALAERYGVAKVTASCGCTCGH